MAASGAWRACALPANGPAGWPKLVPWSQGVPCRYRSRTVCLPLDLEEMVPCRNVVLAATGTGRHIPAGVTGYIHPLPLVHLSKEPGRRQPRCGPCRAWAGAVPDWLVGDHLERGALRRCIMCRDVTATTSTPRDVWPKQRSPRRSRLASAILTAASMRSLTSEHSSMSPAAPRHRMRSARRHEDWSMRRTSAAGNARVPYSQRNDAIVPKPCHLVVQRFGYRPKTQTKLTLALRMVVA